MPVILLPWAYQPLNATRRLRPESAPEANTARPAGQGHDDFNFSSADEVGSLLGDANVRRITPKNMARLSKTLYEAGYISFREHALLSFQPGMPVDGSSRPDQQGQPRDYIDTWERQVDLQQKNGERPDFIRQSKRILNILSNLDALKNPARNDYTA